MKLPFRIVFFLAIISTFRMVAGQTLKPGDLCPALRLKLVNGVAVHLPPTGNGVINFWSSSVSACAKAFPRVSQLADHRSGNAAFIDVAVWSPNEREVKHAWSQGSHSKNEICAIDSGLRQNEGVTSRAWLVATGFDAPWHLPASFIVRNRRIVWIGSTFDLPEMIDRALAPTWDTKLFARMFADQQSRLRKEYAMRHDPALQQLAAAQASINTQKYRQALTQLTPLLSGRSPRTKNLGRYSIPLALFAYRKLGDMKGYYSQSRHAAEVWGNDPHILNLLAWDIVDPESRLPTKDVGFALRSAKKAVLETGRKNPNLLDTLAWAYWASGDRRNATAVENEALKLAGGADRQEMLVARHMFAKGS